MAGRMGARAASCITKDFCRRFQPLQCSTSRRKFAVVCFRPPWSLDDTGAVSWSTARSSQKVPVRTLSHAKVVRYDIALPTTSGHKVIRAKQDARSRMAIVDWSDGTQSRYPYVWLRDSCQCPRCFHGSHNKRLLDICNIDVDVRPTDIQVNAGTVEIHWTDGHASFFESTWLYEHRLKKDAQSEHDHLLSRRSLPWGQDLQHRIPQASLYKIVDSDRGLYNWFCTMEELGVYVIKGRNHRGNPIVDLTNRISTHVPAIPEVAAIISEVGLHNDLTGRNNTPGVRFVEFSELVLTMCDDIELADGFHVAELMRHSYPEEFRILTKTSVQFLDYDNDHYPIYASPTIVTNSQGDIERIVYNNKLRASNQNMLADEAVLFYRALKLFDELLQQNKITIDVNPGDVLCFHNHRVLYGRSARAHCYNGEAYQLCGFLNWNELVSRRRSLQTELSALEQRQRDTSDFTMLQ